MVAKGDIYTVPGQGLNIKAVTVQVTVDWVDDKDVWYRILGRPWDIRSTPIERFKEIIGASA